MIGPPLLWRTRLPSLNKFVPSLCGVRIPSVAHAATLGNALSVHVGSFESVWPDHGDFRSIPVTGHSPDRRACLKGAPNPDSPPWRYGMAAERTGPARHNALKMFSLIVGCALGVWHKRILHSKGATFCQVAYRGNRIAAEQFRWSLVRHTEEYNGFVDQRT